MSRFKILFYQPVLNCFQYCSFVWRGDVVRNFNTHWGEREFIELNILQQIVFRLTVSLRRALEDVWFVWLKVVREVWDTVRGLKKGRVLCTIWMIKYSFTFLIAKVDSCSKIYNLICLWVSFVSHFKESSANQSTVWN